MIARISENLTVAAVLDHLRVDHHGRRRIACPIHGGDGLNFAVLDSGRAWKCFSHNCGAGHRRDAVTLYCLQKFGHAWPDLPAGTKGQALREMAALAGVTLDAPDRNRPRNQFERTMPLVDRARLAEVFADTSLLDGEHAHAVTYESRAAQRAVLFMAVAKSMNQLPESIGPGWLESQRFGDFLNGKT